MATRVALALARMPAFRPALSLRPPRLPSARELAVAAAVACALALGYLAARETSLFAVRAIAITGAPANVAAEARETLSQVVGTSLVEVDAEELERRLREVPSIQSAEVDRAFPHSLTVVVRPERPVAVVRQGGLAWLVAESGRVIDELEPARRPRLPRVRLHTGASPEPGDVLADAEARLALVALRAFRGDFPERVLSVRASAENVTLVLGQWIQLRLGPAVDMAAKVESAAAVLRSLSPEERAGLAYLDVSLPQRPVAAAKPQVGSEG